MEKQKQHIAVVGLGYVGLPLALLADRKGYHVYGIDKDTKKIDLLKSKTCPFKDKLVQQRLEQSNVEFTNDNEKLKHCPIIVICVPTPVNHDHTPNLDPVKSAVKEVAKHMRSGSLVILESTVNPGVSEEIVIPMLEKYSKKKVIRDFHLAHCPERINPGDKKWTVDNIPRVVGASDPIGLKRAKAFYKSILSSKIKLMKSLKEAEAVKIVENSFRDINIAFVNELAQSFSHLNIDVVNVIKGASTKPFAFMAHYPSCGVGGHCIPVDPYYLIDYAKRNGFAHRFLSLARSINNSMPKYTAHLAEELIREKKHDINGSKVTVLGLAYKPNIDDCRESPSFQIIQELQKDHVEVTTYDPYVKDLSTAKNLNEAISGADAVIIATAHNVFRRLSPAFFMKRNVDVVIDGQNCLKEKEFIRSGIFYEGIGKHHDYHSQDKKDYSLNKKHEYSKLYKIKENYHGADIGRTVLHKEK